MKNKAEVSPRFAGIYLESCICAYVKNSHIVSVAAVLAIFAVLSIATIKYKATGLYSCTTTLGYGKLPNGLVKYF